MVLGTIFYNKHTIQCSRPFCDFLILYNP